MRGFMNPGDTLVVTSFDGYVSDDSSDQYKPNMDSKKNKLEALKIYL